MSDDGNSEDIDEDIKLEESNVSGIFAGTIPLDKCVAAVQVFKRIF